MREFFRGWRRKAGCVTLVMACAVSAAWARSYVLADHFVISPGERTAWGFWSVKGALAVRRDLIDELPKWRVIPIQYPHPPLNFDPDFTVLYYWSIALLLTLLSAYLILWKPRTKPKEQTNA